MGLQESKLDQDIGEVVNQDKNNIISELSSSPPISTPLDPRSPSANIARTPLEVILGYKINEGDDASTEIKEKQDIILGLDPRSPTVEFNRTPIIISTVKKENLNKLQNRNLHNVLKSEIQTTPIAKPSKMPTSGSLRVPQNKQTSASSKRRSLVGLLETNMDYTETDLDAVCQAKAKLNASLLEDQQKNEISTLQLKLDKCQLEETIPSQPESEKKAEATVLNEKVINVTAQVKDFDKKLTNLIYEDEDKEVLQIKSCKVKENSRTPLSLRNSNDDNKRCRLKVSDKPRKSESSKIPVLKCHRIKKLGIQCENTPPSLLQESQLNKPHWDSDKTLVI